MSAYYNEHDPKAAAWLRELIKDGLIAPGEVDERSIADVQPGDLVGFRQCHFFAGIGGWSLALRLAGVSDDTEVWTGSPPCQPFSNCGERGGFADPRDLWPHLFRLAAERGPDCIFGEQSGDSPEWIDRAADDMEGIGYAFAPCVIPACAVQAKHERERLWFFAHSSAFNGFAHDSLGEGRAGRAPIEPGGLPGLHVAGRWWNEGEGAQCMPTLVRSFNGLSPILGGFGNAIVPQVAALFIRASLDSLITT